jgi:hypothetical protein
MQIRTTFIRFIGSVGLLAATVLLATAAEAMPARIAWFAVPGNNATKYDAATDVLTIDPGNFGNTAEGSYLVPFPDPFFPSFAISDLQVSLKATIDEAGLLSSGEFELVGGIPDLGVSSGTTLLQGNVNTFFIDDNGPADFFVRFGLEITQSFVPTAPFAEWEQSWVVEPFGKTIDNLFQDDFIAGIPDMRDINFNAIPEPAGSTYLVLGLLFLGLMHFRRLLKKSPTPTSLKH